MLTLNNPTVGVLRVLRQSADTPRSWSLAPVQARSGKYLTSEELQAHEAGLDGMPRRRAVEIARALLADAPELSGYLVQARDHYRYQLLVTRDAVRLVTGSAGALALDRVEGPWRRPGVPAVTGVLPDDAL